MELRPAVVTRLWHVSGALEDPGPDSAAHFAVPQRSRAMFSDAGGVWALQQSPIRPPRYDPSQDVEKAEGAQTDPATVLIPRHLQFSWLSSCQPNAFSRLGRWQKDDPSSHQGRGRTSHDVSNGISLRQHPSVSDCEDGTPQWRGPLSHKCARCEQE